MSRAKELRDLGLDNVLRGSGAWINRYKRRVADLRGWRGTGEDLRRKLVQDGLDLPNNHNSWGAAVMACIKAGTLIPLEEQGRMKLPQSHARSTQILRSQF